MRLVWEDRAWEDYLYWQQHDKQMLKKLNAMIKDIQRGGYSGLGKAEPLRGNLSGLWSRRIDRGNRIVYFIENDMIYIVSCKGHYEK